MSRPSLDEKKIELSQTSEIDRSESEVPEGGWGWMVAFGMALMFIVMVGPLSAFGLIFGDFLEDLGGGTEAITVINGVLGSSVSFTGLITTYALNIYSCRQVGLVGCLLAFVGNFLTIFANSVMYMVFTFGVLQGVGLGLMITPSFAIFNAYFLRRRSYVMSLSQVLIGVGIMVYPIMIQTVYDEYGFRATQAIMTALTLHSLFAMLTYQPVKLHIKVKTRRSLYERNSSQALNTTDIISTGVALKSTDNFGNGIQNNLGIQTEKYSEKCLLLDKTTESMEISNEVDSSSEIFSNKESSELNEELNYPLKIHSGLRSNEQMNNENLSDTPGDETLDQEEPLLKKTHKEHDHDVSSVINMSENSEVGLVAPTSGSQRNLSKASVTSLAGSLEILNKSPSILPSDDVFDKGEDVVNHRVSCWGKIVNFLDLKLLLDPIYSNIAVGIAFTFTADIMFFTIHPIYLFYLGFSNPETAACISIGLACDLGGRLFLTVLGLFAQVKSRTLVLFGSTATVFFRTIFVMYEDHLTIVILTGVLNFFRSFLMVELPLVFAEFCSVERFPSAYGLYLVICGIVGFFVGPIIGIIRDVSGSYSLCIHTMTGLTLVCVIPWILEMLIVQRKQQKSVKISQIL